LLLVCGCKVTAIFWNAKYFLLFFSKKSSKTAVFLCYHQIFI